MTAISFEIFPPKSIDAAFRLADTVSTLAPYDPKFVSVTYGAGGTTRTLTHEAVEAISQYSTEGASDKLSQCADHEKSADGQS